MEQHSEAHPSPPHLGMTSLTPFGTFSKLPLEIRLQIYSLLLPSAKSSRPLSKSITPCHIRDSIEKPLTGPARKLVEIAIIEVSRAISAEVIGLFYSTNTFLFEFPVEFPGSRRPTLRCFANQQANDFPIMQTFTLPSQYACDHIRSLEIEFSSPILGELKEYDMGADLVSMELLKRLQTPRVSRNKLTIYITSFREVSPLWLKTRFFQALLQLPAFEFIKMKLERGRREGHQNQSRLGISLSDDVSQIQIGIVKYVMILEGTSVAVEAVEKEYASIWGPATIRWSGAGARIEFRPRAHSNKLR